MSVSLSGDCGSVVIGDLSLDQQGLLRFRKLLANVDDLRVKLVVTEFARNAFDQPFARQCRQRAFHKLRRLFDPHNFQHSATAFSPFGVEVFDKRFIQPIARPKRAAGRIGDLPWLKRLAAHLSGLRARSRFGAPRERMIM